MSQTKQKTALQKREEKLDKLRLIFGDKVNHYKDLASILIKEGLGKRKDETDTQYLLRIQYCEQCRIPFCFLSLTYIIDAKVSRNVELKGILFAQKYPDFEIVVIRSTDEICEIKGRASPENNWIPITWTIKDAMKRVRLFNGKFSHWGFNKQRMLNKSTKGDFFDLAGGIMMGEAGE